MIPRLDPPSRLLALAAAQEQVLTSEQCRAFGFTRHAVARLVTQEHWFRVLPGVYSLLPGEPSWLARCWIGVLLGGDRSCLGGEAAGHLHGFVEQEPPLISVLIPEASRRVGRDGWEFIRHPEGFRRPPRGGPPRIGVEDAVLDLCAGASEKETIDLVTRAVQQRTTPQQLLRRLAQRSRSGNRELIRAVLTDVAEGAQSPLELRYLHDVERAHGLPPGRRQAPRGQDLRDVLYEDYALVTELDGRVGHDGVGLFRDMARDNRALIAGESSLRFGWPDVVGDPCGVARLVAEMLRRRGWPGELGRCHRCRLVP